MTITATPVIRQALIAAYKKDTPDCGDPAWLQEALDRVEGIPNLWKPAKADWHRVDAIPLLGTGKIDLAAVKRLAREIDGATHD